jgi:predicted Zn finger-like uncharacterized protein
MSLITSCPACATMFRVVPDQLKISEGWVRCGHCSNVFDATAYMVDEDALSRLDGIESGGLASEARPSERETRPVPMETRPAPMETRPVGLESRPIDLPLRSPSLAPATAAQGDDDSVSPDNSSYFGDSQALEASPLDTPFVFRRSDLAPAGDVSVFPPPPADSQLPRDEVQDEEMHDVSFVRNARRKAFWRRPFVRLGLAFVSLLLAAALLLQVAYQDRDRLAQAQPELRPVLLAMCDVMECQLGAPRQIEAIVIESSGFNRVRNDTYRLAFTLRNTARVQVATPAMELTITDSQDQPIARRVLLPAEFGADGKVIPAASDWSASAGVVLALPGTARVAGYRLLAFYP